MECKVQDCETQVRSRGWCSSHYQRWRAHGDPLFDGRAAYHARRNAQRAVEATAEEKTCNICKQTKPLTDFYSRGDWYYKRCKKCFNEATAARRLQDKLDNPKPPRKRVDHGDCFFEGCTKKAYARLKHNKDGNWYCKAHYWQDWMGQELRPLRPVGRAHIDDTFRRCTTCLTVKTHAGFHPRTNGNGLQSECKTCAYKRVRFNLLLSQGRMPEAVEVFESMPSGLQDKMRHRLEGTAA